MADVDREREEKTREDKRQALEAELYQLGFNPGILDAASIVRLNNRMQELTAQIAALPPRPRTINRPNPSTESSHVSGLYYSPLLRHYGDDET